jgi:hypothetical protein
MRITQTKQEFSAEGEALCVIRIVYRESSAGLNNVAALTRYTQVRAIRIFFS